MLKKIALLFVIFSFFSLAPISNATNGDCTQKGVINNKTTLWSCAPQYSTGNGWNYGEKVGTLPAGVEVYVCQKITVGFGRSTQKWAQISYYYDNQWWFAWILKDYIDLTSSNYPLRIRNIFFTVEAFAQTGLTENIRNIDVDKFALPDDQKPPSPDASSRNIDENLPSKLMIYIYLFFSMISGIIAKVIYDIVATKQKVKVKENLLRGLLALIISPMIFLTVIQSADLGIQSPKGFITLILFSFQNGFFWQTIFKGKVDVYTATNQATVT